jgi:hypothetical protein
MLEEEGYASTILLEQPKFLPLAISQAAVYINEADMSLSEYLSLLTSLG